MACLIALRHDSGELSKTKRGSLHSKKRVFVSTATFTISITKNVLSPTSPPLYDRPFQRGHPPQLRHVR